MPVSGVPQAGQASNAESAASIGMRASCRNRVPVETAGRADYHAAMNGDAAKSLRVVERAGPACRVVLRGRTGGGSDTWVLGGYRGATLPDALEDARLEAESPGRYRIRAAQGNFEFAAAAADCIAERPSMFGNLHRPFALRTGERLAARVLLALLRLPGGARLLRRWHAGRTA